jgi:hypothetical protein
VGWSLRLRTRRSHTSTRNTENTASLYWFGPSESKTLRPVLRFVLPRIAGLIGYTRGRLVCLILASRWGQFPDSWSVTIRRPKSRLYILSYPVDLLWSKSTEVLSCMRSLEVVLDLVVWGIFWKVFRRSVGPTWQVGGSSGRPDLLVRDGREPGRWGPRGTHVSQTHIGTSSVSWCY